VADSECCGGQGGIIRVSPPSSSQSILSSGGHFAEPTGIAIARNGDIFVADRDCCIAFQGAVLRVNATTGAQTIVSQGGFFLEPVGLAITADDALLVIDRATGVIRVNPNDGAQTIMSSGQNFRSPSGITVAGNGDIFVADDHCCTTPSVVVRVNPSTGLQTVVSQGGHFMSPFGITVASNGDLLVADVGCCTQGHGGIIRVNPKTGAQSMVSSDGHFYNPFGIAVVPGSIPDQTAADPARATSVDDADKPRKRTEAQRLQRARTNQGSRDDIATEGNVAEVHLDADPPYVIIGNRDGAVVVRLYCGNRCPVIKVGDYIEVDGAKEHEQLYDAEQVRVVR
jgi:hypothetical protein